MYFILELLYVFGGIEQIYGGLITTPQDQAVVEFLQRYWTRFATAGDPNGGDDPSWPAYDPLTDPYLEIAAAPSTGAGLRTVYCDFWDSIPLP